MKYIIEWLFKIIVFSMIGVPTFILLILLSLFMWDFRFLNIADDITNYILKNKK